MKFTKSKASGFTIVEVVLVLAITSLMMISAMLGVRGTINNQRYNDSVNSFRDFLRDQYNSVTNADIVLRDPAIGDNYCGNKIQRGRTGCLLLGKLLKFENTKVSIYGVIGQDAPVGAIVNSDEEYFKSSVSSLRVVGDPKSSGSSPNPEEEYQLNWGATLKHPDGKSDLDKYVLIIRSPLSGSVRTYVMQSERPARAGLDLVLEDLAQKPGYEDNLKRSPAFCVHPEGFAYTNRRAVVIKSNGSNASAVEIAPLDGTVNGVEAVTCK